MNNGQKCLTVFVERREVLLLCVGKEIKFNTLAKKSMMIK